MLLYRRGEVPRASSELKSWKPDEITTAVDELKQFSTPDEDLWAAILLHTELAVTAPFRGDLDGKDFHLQVTSELIQMTNERAGLHRRWLLAMGYYYLSQLEEDLAVASFERALELFPNDGQILVALGSVRETMSLLQGSGSSEIPDSTDGALPPTNSSQYRSMVAKMRGYSVSHSQLKEAETFYRKALELDHANAEAHLRLGRVLQQSGQEDEALQELSWVIENSSNSSYKGTAHLFKGRVLEGRQQYGDALLHFREAVRWQPNWQTAQLALGHALHRAGERRSSKQIIEEAFRPKKRSRQGGLWQYYFCRDRFIDGIRRMRREILL
jgi:tetratricopeptide (TPR) repeat protein